MIDLHVHSTASDATCTPAELASLAAESGVTALALTDHDTVSGLSEARHAFSRLGLRLIPEIELEGESSRSAFPILGLELTESPHERVGGSSACKALGRPRTLGMTITELERQIPRWKEHGLFVAAGPDFHGPTRTDRTLGHTASGVEIDERFLEWLEPDR